MPKLKTVQLTKPANAMDPAKACRAESYRYACLAKIATCTVHVYIAWPLYDGKYSEGNGQNMSF